MKLSHKDKAEAAVKIGEAMSRTGKGGLDGLVFGFLDYLSDHPEIVETVAGLFGYQKGGEQPTTPAVPERKKPT